MHALYDVLRYSAAGAMSNRVDYTNVSEQAKAYTNMCHFGQTEYGSFVLKVFCPTNPLNTSWTAPEEPFGRVATRATLDNFEFLSHHESSDPSVPLPAAFNRQVASAVCRLKPESAFFSGGLHVRFSALSEPGAEELAPKTEAQQIDFDAFIYGRAQSVYDRLKRAEESQREVLQGYIVDLHKDRPESTDTPKHQITLDVKYGGTWRKVTLRLLPAEYRNAVLWHDTGSRVRLDGVIDRRGHVWSVAVLHDLVPMPDRQETGRLF
jgi:hypothetical protein